MRLACTGSGQYGAVGFAYDGGAASGSDESGSEGGDRSSGASGGSDEEGATGREADGLAANLGIDAFGVLLRRAEREEEAAADGQASKKKTCAPLFPPFRVHGFGVFRACRMVIGDSCGNSLSLLGAAHRAA